MYEYRVTEIIRVVDGDTIDTRLSLGFGQTATLRVRLFDIDAPETKGVNADPVRGPAATTFVEDWMEAHFPAGLIIRTEKSSDATIGIGDGAFGRWLGTFVDQATGEVLQDAMRDAGHVK